MAITLEDDLIMSISELAASLETNPQYMKAALEKAGITILVMNRRPGQQYIALRAVHEYLMRREDGS